MFIFMLIFNKKNIIKSLMLTSLSLSLTLAACLSNQGNIIRAEDIGAQNSINEQELIEADREFLDQNRHRINFIEEQFPSDTTNNTEHVPDHCRETDKSVISDENDGDDTLSIYVGGVSGEERNAIISCGLKKFQNKLQANRAVDDLESRVDNLMKLINRSDDSGEIRGFYDANKENIKVSFQETGGPYPPRFVFRDRLILKAEDDDYLIRIDSRLEEDTQAHLLAHALSIIAIETDEANIETVSKITGLITFPSIQKLYYSGNNSRLSTSLFGPHGRRDEVAKTTIIAFYFYSRFHAYQTNRELQQEGLILNHDLDDAIINEEIIRQLSRKDLRPDKETEKNLKSFVRSEPRFDIFINHIISN